jgi:tetratricopeptide (TPR) repeat protein
MTELDTASDVQALIQRGNVALRSGDIIEAQKAFRQASEKAPDNPAAWLGLAGSVRAYTEKKKHLQRVLELDPTHAEARESLAFIEQKLARGEVLAPRATPTQEPETESVSEAEEQHDHPDDEHGHIPPVAAATPEAAVGVCYRHPERETGLRCVQCGRFICTECVRPAFVGQLCPECSKERRPTNYKVTPGNLSIAAPITIFFSVLYSTLIVLFLPGFFFAFLVAFFLAPMAGELLLRILDALTKNKRGKEMQITVGVAYGMGATVTALLFAFTLPMLLFTVIAIATLVGRLR